MRYLVLSSILLLALNCAPPFVEMSTDIGYDLEDLHSEEIHDPYVRVYQALYETLKWYTFPAEDGGPSEHPAQVYETEWPEQQMRRMYVNSRINADFDCKTRMQIVAMVLRDRFNECTPMIYVWQQMEIEELHEARPAGNPALFGPADNDARWVNFARNERMEARLLNKAYEMLEGGNLFSGRFGLDSRPWVEWAPESEPVPDEFLPNEENEEE